jgi:anti-sigma regulatory factor (Ser/Thr protein kinase)
VRSDAKPRAPGCAHGRADRWVRECRMQQMVPQPLIELPQDVSAPAHARRHCERVCRDWSLGRLVDECDLLVSELVTNAVLHGAGPVVLEVVRQGSGVRVTVTDMASAGAVVPRDASARDEDGRGLAIVAAIATRWGSHHDELGTCVWFELGA